METFLSKNCEETLDFAKNFAKNLTDKDLSLRYSETYEGYFASLSQQTKTLFENMPRAKVNIVIETEYNDKTIVGIDYNGFENFEIDTLTITGDVDKFYLLEKSMYGTNLQTFQYSNNIIFDYDGKTVDLVFDSTDFIQEVAE